MEQAERKKIIESLVQGFESERRDIEAVPANYYVIMWGDQALYTDANGTLGSVIANKLDRATRKVWYSPSLARALEVATQFRGIAGDSDESVKATSVSDALAHITAKQDGTLAAINRMK